MKYRISLALLALIAVGVVAGCGGGGSKVKTAKLEASDVAVVGTSHVTQTQFDQLMANGEQTYKSEGQSWPKQGTAQYAQLKSQAVTALVQQAMLNEKATQLGIDITDKKVEARLDQLIKQSFGGDRKKFEAQVKKEKTTDAAVKAEVRNQLVDQALYKKVTANVKVTDAKIDAYFKQNSSQFPDAASSRQVRHILVKKKALADSIYKQLKNGNDKTWCTLAKKYSQDPSSKDKCGKLTVTKGETVAVFDNVAFGDGKTGVVHTPVYDSQQYKSYFIIEPLTPIKPGASKPTAAEKAQIQNALASTQKNTFMNNWVTDLEKTYCKSKAIDYATGYQPSPDLCTSVTSTAASTATTSG
jgi:parvulin-like peptidyl-prolyl isomerase